MTPRVSIEELSRLVDGELSSEERASIESRLEACPTSQALLGRMQQVTQTLQSDVAGAIAPAHEVGTDCLREEQVVRLAGGGLDTGEKQKLEEHLLGCSVCLQTVMQTVRTATSMRSARWPALPDHVAQSLGLPSPSDQEPPPLTQESTSSCQFHLGAESAEVATFESNEMVAVVRATSVSPTALQADVSLHQKTRSRRCVEVVLHDSATRKKLFAVMTDGAGKASIPRIPAGEFYLDIPQANIRIDMTVSGE